MQLTNTVNKREFLLLPWDVTIAFPRILFVSNRVMSRQKKILLRHMCESFDNVAICIQVNISYIFIINKIIVSTL